MRRQVHGVTIEIVRGDIADQPDMEAVVNAANAEGWTPLFIRNPYLGCRTFSELLDAASPTPGCRRRGPREPRQRLDDLEVDEDVQGHPWARPRQVEETAHPFMGRPTAATCSMESEVVAGGLH